MGWIIVVPAVDCTPDLHIFTQLFHVISAHIITSSVLSLVIPFTNPAVLVVGWLSMSLSLSLDVDIICHEKLNYDDAKMNLAIKNIYQ